MFLAIAHGDNEALIGSVIIALVGPNGKRDYTRPFVVREAGTRNIFSCIVPNPATQCRELGDGEAIDLLNRVR